MDVCFTGGEKTEITVDSGAEENVCPKECGDQFGLQRPERWMKFRGANGKEIEHYGAREVQVLPIF